MARNKEFEEATPQPLVVKDSRFGLRKLFLNVKERPRVKSYSKPGRGQQGESSN